MMIFNESGKGYWMEGFGCIRAEGENRPSRPGHIVILNDQGGSVMDISDDVTATLRAQDHGHPPVVCFQQNQREEVRDMGEQAGALTAESGMHNTNYVIYQTPVCAAFMGGQGAKARSIAYSEDISPTIKSVLSGGNTIPDVVYPINLMVATRGGKDDMRTCFGVGEPDEPQFTLSAAHEHGVCYEVRDG